MREYPTLSGEIGSLLLLCREMKGKTLRQVSADTGISNPFISQLENGKVLPGLEICITLCDYYGIKIDRIVNLVRKYRSHPDDQIYPMP